MDPRRPIAPSRQRRKVRGTYVYVCTYVRGEGVHSSALVARRAARVRASDTWANDSLTACGHACRAHMGGPCAAAPAYDRRRAAGPTRSFTYCHPTTPSVRLSRSITLTGAN